jgi:hypothetical protein
MAIKRLIDKFMKKFNWDGKNFRALVVNIFAKGNKTIEDKVLQDVFSDWKKQEEKIGKIDLPNVEDFLSTNAKLVRVASIKSKEVTETLKQSLLTDLRVSIEESGLRGNLLDDKTMDKFKGKLRKTFDNYIEKDGITPGKLEQIALTESRGIVNTKKYKYAISVINNNPDIRMEKIWHHYPWKSKEPRKGHAVPFNWKFKVNYYVKVKKVWVKKGVDYMRYPHDPNIDARQIVSCHCDIRFDVKRKKDE